MTLGPELVNVTLKERSESRKELIVRWVESIWPKCISCSDKHFMVKIPASKRPKRDFPTNSLSLSLSLSHTHTHTHTPSYTHTLSSLSFSCTHLNSPSNSLSLKFSSNHNKHVFSNRKMKQLSLSLSFSLSLSSNNHDVRGQTLIAQWQADLLSPSIFQSRVQIPIPCLFGIELI